MALVHHGGHVAGEGTEMNLSRGSEGGSEIDIGIDVCEWIVVRQVGKVP